MTSTTEPIATNTISICVYEEVRVWEVCGACLLILIEGINFGYLCAKTEDFKGNIFQAYNILFDETLKRLELKGIRLRL